MLQCKKTSVSFKEKLMKSLQVFTTSIFPEWEMKGGLRVCALFFLTLVCIFDLLHTVSVALQ